MLNLCKNTINPLSHRNAFHFYIYLRDHQKKIQPEQSKAKLSYMQPAKLVQGMPVQPWYEPQLKRHVQSELDRKIFEEYRKKILIGEIDIEPEKIIDPLWGEEQKPIHYYSKMSKLQLMAVSHPQNLDVEPYLIAMFSKSFQSSTQTPQQQITKDFIELQDPHELVNVALFLRNNKIQNRELYHAIERKLHGGQKLYLLKAQQLIKMKYAFDGLIKYGTPKFHEILSALLNEDACKMSKDELVKLFYACRYSNQGKTNLQLTCLLHLEPLYASMSVEEKIKFYMMFVSCNHPLKLRRSSKRHTFEHRYQANNVLFRLGFDEITFDPSSCAMLIFALAKSRIPNTKHITIQIQSYIEQHMQQFISDPKRLYMAITYLPEVDGGVGIYTKEIYSQFKDQVILFWNEYSSMEKIRIIYTFWNYKLMDESVMELYKSIPIQSDSTLLSYFCQIQFSVSSEREWQVLHCIAKLQYIPLPYFLHYKRFYNYIKYTTQWDLLPIEDKLINTEYHYNALRYRDKFRNVRFYNNFLQLQAFTKLTISRFDVPVHNLEIVQFATPQYQVSLDIVNQVEFIPGTQDYKETYLNKVKSLLHLGWKHLTYTEAELENKNGFQAFGLILHAHAEHIEAQLQVIALADQKRAIEVNQYRYIAEDKGLKGYELENMLNDGQLLDEHTMKDNMTKKIAENAEALFLKEQNKSA